MHKKFLMALLMALMFISIKKVVLIAHPYTSAQELRIRLNEVLKNASRDDSAIKYEAATLMQEAFNTFYFSSRSNETEVTTMIQNYYNKYGESPFLEFQSEELTNLRSIAADRQSQYKRMIADVEKETGSKMERVLKELKEERGKFKTLEKEYGNLLKNFREKQPDLSNQLQKILREKKELEENIENLENQLDDLASAKGRGTFKREESEAPLFKLDD